MQTPYMQDLADLDAQIEETKNILRSGGKSAERNATTALMGADSDEAQIEAAIHRLMVLARARETLTTKF